MNLRAFYEHTLPSTGNYTLFIAGTQRHIWTESLAELVELTERQTGTDVYFATATFDEPINRKQVNVDSKKCFYLDLDAGEKKFAKHGPEKTYETQQHALQGVKDFLQAGGPKPTLIVSSGEGLHLYWELKHPVPAVLWTPIAKQFQKYAVGLGLKVDSAVTADSARVLRPVGTTHPNGKTVAVLNSSKHTYTHKEFAAAIGQAQEAAPEATRFSQEDLDINDDVAAVQGPPKSIKKILEHCGAARYAAANQDSVEEPYWRAMIGLAKHTVEGREAAHALSCKHPEYDAAKTDNYFDRWATGPTTCEKFAEFRPEACAKCPSRGKQKSPISLGAMTVVEVEALPEDKKPAPATEPQETTEPWNGCVPKGFDVVQFKGKRALVHFMDIERENGDGEMVSTRVTVPVSHEIFWLGHWADAAHADDFAQATVFRLDEDKRVSAFTMEQSLAASKVELAKFYAGKGIHTTAHKQSGAAMEAYTKASLQLIKSKGRRPKIHDRMGLFVTPDGHMLCAQGKYAILSDGTITETILSPNLRTVADFYHIPLPESRDGTWTSSVWKEHIMPQARVHTDFMKRYYGTDGMAKYQLAFMMGLASPLMAFVDGGYTQGPRLPRNGLSVALYSRDGGRGKTTVMQSALLAYGRPKELNKDSNNMGSTNLGRTGVLSLAGTMPVGMDEMGSTDASAIAGLISAIANGTSRTGMTKDGGMINRAPWALIAMLATNRSARDMINEVSGESNAIQYRLLEIDVDNMPDFSIDERERFGDDWDNVVHSAGALGAVIHLMICKAGPVEMSALVRTKVNEASRLIQSVQGDRFQYRGLGAMLVLQMLLEKAGLAMFSTATLVETFRLCHANAGDYIKENVLTSNHFELLSKALHDLHQHTVATATEAAAGRGAVPDASITGRVPDVVKARHIVNTGVTYVAADAMREWCTDHKVRLADIVHSAKTSGVMIHVYPSDGGAMGRSTRWAAPKNLLVGMKESNGASVSCYAFSTKALAAKVGGDAASVEAMIAAQISERPKVVPIKAAA